VYVKDQKSESSFALHRVHFIHLAHPWTLENHIVNSKGVGFQHFSQWGRDIRRWWLQEVCKGTLPKQLWRPFCVRTRHWTMKKDQKVTQLRKSLFVGKSENDILTYYT